MKANRNTNEFRGALIILNPSAGWGRAARHAAEVEGILRGAGFPFEVAATSRPGEATELARDAAAAGRDLVVAAGGDGTAHEVANGLVGSGTVMGLLPLGSGNDLARTLGVPRDLPGACRLLARGAARAIDVGSVEGEVFVNGIGIGLDGVVLEKIRARRWLPGSAVYLEGIIRALWSYRPLAVEIRYDGARLALAVTLVAVANGPYVGGGIPIAPGAGIDDGLFDLCIVGASSRFEVIRRLGKAYRGAHTRLPQVTMARAAAVTVEMERAAPLQMDGELFLPKTARVEVSLRPRALRVLGAPAG